MSSTTPRTGVDTGNSDSELAVRELQRLVSGGHPSPTEAVLDRFPALTADREKLLELIYTEFVLRESRGQIVGVDEWIQRFPDLAEDLRQLFHVHDHLSLDGSAPDAAGDSWNSAGGEEAETDRIGKYHLLERIGHGGGGDVFRARHEALGRIVALKLMHGDSQPEAHLRFRQEAEAAAALQHPNIVQIHEVGLHQGRPWLVMEYVAGGNLASVIQRHPLSGRQAAQILERLARAIHHAHERGIIHRDLKPANVLLAPSDRDEAIDLGLERDDSAGLARVEPKVTDFGLARRLDRETLRTLPGAILGTPSYMAPEQAAGHPELVGPASDVYALGAILYDALAGRPPFHAATIVETLQQVRTDDPVSLRNIQPDVPRDLATICQKCLQKEPGRRYLSAAALADDLGRFMQGRPIVARPTAWWERGIKWARHHPAAAALLALLVIGAAAVSGLWLRAEHHRGQAEQNLAAADLARGQVRAEHAQLERAAYAHDIALAHHELESGFTTRAGRLLEATPPGLRNWEYQYLLTLSHDALREFAESGEPLIAVDISPDSRWLASSSTRWGTNHEPDVTIRDLASGEVHARLQGHVSSVLDVRFSPDGRLVATAGTIWQRPGSRDGGRVLLWDAATGRLLRELTPRHATRVAFSPDGSRLAAGLFTGEIQLFGMPDGELLATLEGPRGMVFDVDFHPDGKLLVAGSRDGTCRIWNVETGEMELVADGLADVRAVDFSPAGDCLAIANYGGDVRVCVRRDGHWQERFRHRQPGRLSRLCFSPDGLSLAVALQGGGARLIDPVGGQTLRRLAGHNNDALAVAFSHDGQWLASAGSDGHVRVHDLARPANPLDTSRNGPFFVDVARIPGQTLIALAQTRNTRRSDVPADRSVRFWDTRRGDWAPSLEGQTAWQSCLDADRQGRWIASGGEDGTICVWELGTIRLLHRLAGHSGPVLDLAFLDDSETLISCGADSGVRAWDIHSGRPLDSWQYGDDSPRWLAAPAGGGLVVGSAKGTLHLRTAGGGGDVAVWQAGELLRSLATSRDGRLAAVGGEGGGIAVVSLDRLRAGEEPLLSRLEGHAAPVTGLAFTPDGARLASAAADNCVRLWDVGSGQEVLRLTRDELQPDPVLSFDDAGDALLVAAGNRITVWRGEPAAEGLASSRPASAESGVVRQWRERELERARASRNWFAARQHLAMLLAKDPGNARLLALRGAARAALEDFRGAAGDFRAAFDTGRQLRDLCRFGMLNLRMGDRAAWRAACGEVLDLTADAETTPASLNSAVWLCALAADSRTDWDALARRMEVHADSASADYLNTFGAILYRQGRFADAIAVLQRGLDLRGADAEAPFDWLFLGLACRAGGQPERAAALFRQLDAWWGERQFRNSLDQESDRAIAWDQRCELEILLPEWHEATRGSPEEGPDGPH